MGYDIGRTLDELGINGFTLEGNPTTEAEFHAQFRKIVGHDDDGFAIFSSDPNDFGVTWDQVVGAKAALDATFGKEDLRYERNRRLAETDFWALKDAPAMTAEQTAYRQALRDITETYTSLEDVVWPTKPE